MNLKITQNTDHMSNEDYRKFVILNKSNHSYALNNKITEILNNRSWAGQQCFIIAGGVSLKDLDLNRLNGKNTIGVNMSFLKYSATINYSMDSDIYDGIYDGRYDKQQECNVLEKWRACPSMKVFLTPMELKIFGGKDVHLVRRKAVPSTDYVDLDAGIYGGINSATGAINLALSLGCHEIFLLGYDMHCTTQSHWHKGYPNRNINEFNTQLLKYKAELEQLAPSWSTHGAAILNLNLNSNLKCFPFGNLDRVLGD